MRENSFQTWRVVKRIDEMNVLKMLSPTGGECLKSSYGNNLVRVRACSINNRSSRWTINKQYQKYSPGYQPNNWHLYCIRSYSTYIYTIY